MARAAHHNETDPPRDILPSAPRPDLGERIRANDEEQIVRRRDPGLQLLDGIDRVAALNALFQAGNLETGLALAGQLGHAHSGVVRSVSDSGLVGRMGGGDEEHAVKLETVRRSPGDRQWAS